MILEELRRHVGKFYGKYAGEVSAVEDDQFLGRIMVTVPSVFGSTSPVRARPCFPSGHFFVPPVGAKVWIEFEAGDTRYPLWVGTYYPANGAPPEASKNPPDGRIIHTPSGHTVEFQDAEGEEKIVIRHKENSFVSIDKDGNVLIANKTGSHLHLDAAQGNATLMEEHGNLLTMSADGTVLVGKDGTMVELTGDTVRLMASKILLQGSSVMLGAGATEPTILGQTFADMWNTFIFHTHTTGVGPSGPPIPTGPPWTPLLPGKGLTSAVVVK